MARVPSRPVEQILRDRGLDIPVEDTFQELADRGHELEVDARGEDVVDRWLNRKLAEVELSRGELEEYALSLGEHLNHVTHEGWATWVSGFEQRAAGLFIAVEATIQQLDRIHEARVKVEDGDMARLGLTAFDFVNALGIRTYDEIILDHQEWMDELAAQSPEVVEQSPLLQFFTDDFNALARESHQSLRNKIVGQATLTAELDGTDAPTPGEGMFGEGNTIWLRATAGFDRLVTSEDVNEVSRMVEEALGVSARNSFCLQSGRNVDCFVKFDKQLMGTDLLQNFKSRLEEGFETGAINPTLKAFVVVDKEKVSEEIPAAVGEPATELV